jgi:DNA-binding CsgD family transcriptional regulator
MAAQYLVAAARHAWECGEPHRARALLRQVRPDDVPAQVNAEWALLQGEIELRVGATTHALHTLLRAADELTADPKHTVSALTRAGEAVPRSGDYADFSGLARRALALRRSDESLNTNLLFEQLVGLKALFKGNLGEAYAPLRRVIELAAQLNDAPSQMQAALASLLLGDMEETIRLAVRSAALARATGEATAVPQALELAGTAEFALGRYEAAAATLIEALPLARATGQTGLASSLTAGLGLNAAVFGDRTTCLARIREARTYATSHQAVGPEAVIAYALGMLDLVPRPADAFNRLRALQAETGRGQLVIAVAATANVVETAIRAGDRDAGVEAFAAFEPWARWTGQPNWLALIERCQALLAENEGVAETHFKAALRHRAGAAEPERDFELARTELLFGQALRRWRRPRDARDHLRAAVAGFQQFNAAVWTDLAESELRATGDPTRTDQACWDDLTPQQLQIAQLVAKGATNREVADQLSISVRTVDHHMRSIFVRLKIRSRVELANLIE